VTALVEDRSEARIHGLLEGLRAAEADLRRSYARVLSVVAELDAEKAGAIAGFGSTVRLLSGVLNLSKGEAKARVEQAELLMPRRSLTGEELPPRLPATAAELAAGELGARTSAGDHRNHAPDPASDGSGDRRAGRADPGLLGVPVRPGSR
jgi:hypothetical protein